MGALGLWTVGRGRSGLDWNWVHLLLVAGWAGLLSGARAGRSWAGGRASVPRCVWNDVLTFKKRKYFSTCYTTLQRVLHAMYMLRFAFWY